MQMIPLGVSVPPGTTNTHTGDTNESNLGNIALAPNVMGPFGLIRITASFLCTNNANNKSLQLRLAPVPSAIGLAGTQAVLTGLASVTGATLFLYIRNLGVTNSQACVAQIPAPAEVVLAQDTTQPLFLCFNVTLAVGTDSITLRWAFAEVFTGP
jgi:hypothetical protein